MGSGAPKRPSLLGVLPAPGGSLTDLARNGQLGRLLDYYFPAYLERFERVRYFSYEPERIEELTEDRALRARVEVLAPRRAGSRHLRAASLGLAGAGKLRDCGVVRVLQASGGLAPFLAGVRFVCTYGYSYPSFTTVRVARPFGPIARTLKQAALRQELRLVLRRAAWTIVTSDAGETEARELGARRIHWIPNGVDTELFAPGRVRRDIDVTFVGQLVERKDPATLVRALSRLERPPRVFFVGEGEERERLARLCIDAGIDATFPGALPHREVAAILARSRCFVLPSRIEGHPKALLEAMSTGVPSIGSDIPGIRELADGQVLLFPPGDSAALAGQLARFLNDDVRLAEAMSRKARQTIVRDFDLRKLLEKEVALLASELEQPR